MPLRKAVEREIEEKKAPTRPWDTKGASANPWQPDYLRLAKKRKGFRARWVPVGSLDQKVLQGWQIASPSDYGVTDKHADDASAVGSRIQRRELVLMEMPEELLDQRAAYLEERSKAARRAAKREVINEARKANQQYRDMGGEGDVVQITDESKDEDSAD